MKAQVKLTLGTVIAIIAVLVASHSVNQAAVTKKIKHEQIKVEPQPFYSNEDVEFLMRANHWTRQEVVRVLDLSLKAADAANVSRIKN